MVYAIANDYNKDEYEWMKGESKTLDVQVHGFDKTYIKNALVKSVKRFEVKDVETGDVTFEERSILTLDTNEIVKIAKEQVVSDCKSLYGVEPKNISIRIDRADAQINKAFFYFSYTMEYPVYTLSENEVVTMFVDGYVHDEQNQLSIADKTKVLFICHVSDFR